jgi:hypothetical protein
MTPILKIIYHPCLGGRLTIPGCTETGKYCTIGFAFRIRRLSLLQEGLAPRIRELVSRKNELGARRDEAMQTLEAKRMEIQDVEVIRRYVEDLRSLLGSASIVEQKAFLRSFVKSIEVGHEEATIHYTIPMPLENSADDKIGVLSLIRNGSAYRIRTGDLLLEREVSLTPRRMRHYNLNAIAQIHQC